jgi:tripartite-type tricarboxylate transporter receptor subunit TctC
MAVACLAVAPSHAADPAAGYPARPVRLIVPFAPGAGQDLTGRMVAQKLSEAWGQQVIVDNRPGAGSSIGAEIAARAVPDGHTLLICNEALAINASLTAKPAFDPLKDFAPVSQLLVNPRVFVANVSLPAATIKEAVALARAKPGSIRYGSSGVGTGPHLAGALLASMAKVEMIHVPYKGAAPALVDTIGGQIQMVAATLITGMPHLQSGKLKALGVTSTKRSSVLPDVPTVAESGLPGFEAVAWTMLAAPAKTPRAIVARLHADTVRLLESADVRKRITAEGADMIASRPDEAAAYLRDEIKRWGAVIREAGVRPGEG